MTRADGLGAGAPHRRFNPLLGEWVLVSPQRTERPWQGQQEAAPAAPAPRHDPGCYLCPGNGRAQGATNPNYEGVFAFDNDYPALLPAPQASLSGGGGAAERRLLRAQPERGRCRVVCFSPRHDLTLPRLGQAAVEAVVAAWTAEYRQLCGEGWKEVTIFENRGAAMGASNPHPHGQIWAAAHYGGQAARELQALGRYRRRHRRCLLCEYARVEARRQERVICENAGFVAVVPYWAVWPFEALLLSRAHRGGLEELGAQERALLAEMLIRLGTHYDNLFRTPFPLSWGFHLPPGGAHPACHLHAHFHPPLLRSATVRKFMVGYELLAMPQRDLTPELAAARLRAAGGRHYWDGGSADGGSAEN